MINFGVFVLNNYITFQASQITLNARREPKLLEVAYHCMHIKEKWPRLGEKGCLWTHGPSAIPIPLHRAVSTARPIPSSSWSCSAPGHHSPDSPPQRTTTRPPPFLWTIHKTGSCIHQKWPQPLKNCVCYSVSITHSCNRAYRSESKTPNKSWPILNNFRH